MKAVRASALVLLVVAAAAAAGCGGTSETAADGDVAGKLVVWDYYGSATPIKPAIAAFEKLHPDVDVDYQSLDYETMRDKFSVGVSSDAAPDLATLDMTWLPTYAAQGTLADLSQLSGEQLNGRPISAQYSAGADAAMKYDGKRVAMLYDFDAYALYYRADKLREKGIAVPRDWAQFRSAAKQLAEGSGKTLRYGFQVLPDTFHFAQFLFQNGGAILNGDDTAAAFQQPAGVEALDFWRGFLDDGSGVYWGVDAGDSTGIPGIKDERIGMFLNGPYMMGVLKESAPEQSGKWKVAPAPVGKRQGSYLGGTGLVIPVNAEHTSAAWAFAQFLLTERQQLDVYRYAGAAPATEAALSSPEMNRPDPYFGGEAPFRWFRAAQATATPFPYVKPWDDVDRAITDGVTVGLLGRASSEEALGKAASTTDDLLAADG